MFKIKELLVLNIQVVFLTGTLPFSFEEELVNRLYLKDLTVIRASCSRSNISYRASAYKSNKEEERIKEIKQYISDFRAKEYLTKDDKVLIFCPNKNNIELVASTLNCSRYYSELSKEEKTEILNNFLTSKEDYYNTLISSSALEEGFDYSSIRLVVYKDLAYSFLGFLQGSSRGGRDNQPSSCIFFYNSKDSRLASSSTSNTSLLDKDKYLVYSYLRETICRRRQISLYLDNKVVDKCSAIENNCDLCFTRASISNKQVSRILKSNKHSEQEREEVKKLLNKVISRCIYCYILVNIEEVNLEVHSCSLCPLYSSIETLSKKIKKLVHNKEIVLKKNSCCFNCLFPTVICKHIRESSNCLNNKIMFRLLGLLYTKQVVLGLTTKYNLRENISIKEFLQVFLNKVYLFKLDTEGILAFKVLVSD